MSSPVFKARTTHTATNPQVCGLHEVTGCSAHIDGLGDVPGAIIGTDTAGDLADKCFYLTCLGTDARPERQIFTSKKKDDYDTGYRVVPSGKYRTVGNGRFTYQKPIFKHQEWSCKSDFTCKRSPVDCAAEGHMGGWRDVRTWEKMVHADCAVNATYSVPGHETDAYKGARTEGLGHELEDTFESPLEDLGRALADLDLGDDE